MREGHSLTLVGHGGVEKDREGTGKETSWEASQTCRGT